MPNKKNSSTSKKTFIPARGAPSHLRRHGATRKTTVRAITFVRNWESDSSLGQLSFDINNVLESVGTAPASPTKVPVVIASPLARPLQDSEEDQVEEEPVEDDHEAEATADDDNFVPETQQTPSQHKGPIDFDQDDEPVVSESPESDRPSSSPKTSEQSPASPQTDQQEPLIGQRQDDQHQPSQDPESQETQPQVAVENPGTTPLNIDVGSSPGPETPSRVVLSGSPSSVPASLRRTPSVHERISPRPIHQTRSSRKKPGPGALFFRKRLHPSMGSAPNTSRMSIGEPSIQSFNMASVLRSPKSPVVRTPRKRPHAATVPKSPKHTCVRDTEGHEVRLWQGDRGRRGVKDILDLDILLNIFEESAWETRQQLDTGAARRALNSLAKETQKDLRETILKQAQVRNLQSSLNKSQRRLNKSRKHLLALQQKHTDLMYKIAKKKQSQVQQTEDDS